MSPLQLLRLNLKRTCITTNNNVPIYKPRRRVAVLQKSRDLNPLKTKDLELQPQKILTERLSSLIALACKIRQQCYQLPDQEEFIFPFKKYLSNENCSLKAEEAGKTEVFMLFMVSIRTYDGLRNKILFLSLDTALEDKRHAILSSQLKSGMTNSLQLFLGVWRQNLQLISISPWIKKIILVIWPHTNLTHSKPI